MNYHDNRCENYNKLYGFETQLGAGKIWDEKRAAKGLFLHQGTASQRLLEAYAREKQAASTQPLLLITDGAKTYPNKERNK